MESYTTSDLLKGLCTMDQVGKPKAPSTVPLGPSSITPEAFIGEWMEVYKAIGGRSALETFARDNPIKFYDQLMKLLVSMEAPKQVMSIHLERGALTEHELESLSTLELKKRLMGSGGAILEGEFESP